MQLSIPRLRLVRCRGSGLGSLYFETLSPTGSSAHNVHVWDRSLEGRLDFMKETESTWGNFRWTRCTDQAGDLKPEYRPNALRLWLGTPQYTQSGKLWTVPTTTGSARKRKIRGGRFQRRVKYGCEGLVQLLPKCSWEEGELVAQILQGVSGRSSEHSITRKRPMVCSRNCVGR